MWNQSIRTPRDKLASSWSNRILILATAGILFLTLYPFRFNFHVLPNSASPFLLGQSRKNGLLDAFLNVLLFVPFGFGLAEKLRERGKSSRFALITAFAAGALFSYTIELLQLYIPERDSGWEDVFTNGSGSLLGSILYLAIGSRVVRPLTSAQRYFSTLTPVRLASVLLTYFCFWCGLAALMQTQTRLSNWKPDATLVLGNDGSGQNPWRGQVRTLQIWDRAANGGATGSPFADQGAAPQATAPIIDYDFSRASDLTSQSLAGPKLFWIPAAPVLAISQSLTLDGKSWLSTKASAGDLIEDLQKTNQFTVHVACTPTDLAGADGRIVSISDSAGVADMTLRQEDANLVFWFRTPLAAKHALLAWYVPGVFGERRERDIVYSYDGSNLLLALDGKKQRLIYKLGPGTVLARVVRRVKAAELEGYIYAFYALVFAFGGFLLSLSVSGKNPKLDPSMVGSLPLTICVAAALFERVLASVSGRMFSWSYVVFSIVLGVAGLLWGSSDAGFRPQESDS
jgi:glycopeptide antibiotics resistance protein